MKIFAIVLAGGSGTRMGAGVNKVLLPVAGKACLRRSVEAFGGLADEMVVVCRAAEREAAGMVLAGCDALFPLHYAEGGDTRQASVLSGLRAITLGPEDLVLVHDGARCLVTEEIIRRVIGSCREYGTGVAAMPVSDTIRRVDVSPAVTVDRSRLMAIQTPQGFNGRLLLDAAVRAEADGFQGTDDASLLERLGQEVHYVTGGKNNLKMTTPEDLKMAEALLGNPVPDLRIGQGYDVHRLTENRKLILCGVEIPWELGLLGHSDADVALHALMDAMLGAAAMGDIGKHFPDTDPAYSGISSMVLLEKTAELLKENGFAMMNADVTIVAQRPKLAPYIPEMRKNIAETLGIEMSRVSVKATTTEKLGFEGRGEGIAAQAVCMVWKK